MTYHVLKTAFGYSPKHKEYTYGAYILTTYCDGLPGRDTFKEFVSWATADTKEQAREKCLARVFKDNDFLASINVTRENIKEDHAGRVQTACLTGYPLY